MFYRLLALAAWAACWPPAPPSQPDHPIKPRPAPPTAQANADWENLGVSPNGNILNELDKLSIKQQGSVVTFRDRKTIFNVKKKTSCPPHGTRLPSTAG
jgi:hypothetical protein